MPARFAGRARLDDQFANGQRVEMLVGLWFRARSLTGPAKRMCVLRSGSANILGFWRALLPKRGEHMPLRTLAVSLLAVWVGIGLAGVREADAYHSCANHPPYRCGTKVGAAAAMGRASDLCHATCVAQCQQKRQAMGLPTGHHNGRCLKACGGPCQLNDSVMSHAETLRADLK